MRLHSIDALSTICEYLDVPSLQGLYNSVHETRHSFLRCALGSSLRSVHSGYFGDESVAFYLTDHVDDGNNRNGFLTWLLIAPKAIRSIKLLLKSAVNPEQFCKVVHVMMEIFASGRCQSLESFVIISDKMDFIRIQSLEQTITSFMQSISDACTKGNLLNLRDFDISPSYVLTNNLINSLRRYCPELLSIGSMNNCPEALLNYFDYKLDGASLMNSEPFLGWRSVTSLDVSDLIAARRDRGGSLEEASEHLIHNLSSGTFPKLTKLLFRYQSRLLDNGEEPDSLLVFVRACYDYFARCEISFFGSQVLVFEIDSADLDPHSHFKNSQDWADLAKKFTPTTEQSNVHAHYTKRGLFPNLEILRCNNWLPCSQLLRMFCGNVPRGTIQSKGRREEERQSVIYTRDNSNINKIRTTSRLNSAENFSQSGCNPILGLRLEVCPGIEDPCFSSFLSNLWDPEIIPIWCLLVRRKRRLVYGKFRNFCDYDLGYRTDKESTINPNPLYYDQPEECYDGRPKIIGFDSYFADEYCINNDFFSDCTEQQVVCAAILKCIQEGRFCNIKVLGLCEEFFRFVGFFQKNIAERELISIGTIFNDCLSLETLYIYLDSELRSPLDMRRLKEVTSAIIVILSSFTTMIPMGKKKMTLKVKENDNVCSNGSIHDENKNRKPTSHSKDVHLIETVIIDFPSQIFYKYVRRELCKYMKPLSAVNRTDKTKNCNDKLSSKRGKVEDGDTCDHSANIILKIIHLSMECSFIWSGDPGSNILHEAQNNLD